MCNRLLFAALICLLPPAGPALGQATGQSCSLIEDEPKRLLCYDLVFRNTAAASGIDSTTEEASLDPELAATWPMTSVPAPGGRGQLLSISNRAPEPMTNSDQFAKLTVSCANNSTSLRFVFPGYFMTNDGKGNILTTRVDGGDASDLEVRATDSMLSLPAGGGSIALIERMLTAENLAVTANPSSGAPVEARFDLAGLSQAIRPIREACGW